jgi:CBS domain-containing protein
MASGSAPLGDRHVSSERSFRRETDRDIKLEEVMHPAVTVTPDVLEREALKVLMENNVPGYFCHQGHGCAS